MRRKVYIYISSADIEKLNRLFDAFGPSYKEYVLSCEEDKEVFLTEDQFNSLRKRMLHCILRKTDTHMKEIFDFDVHTKGCTICKWIAEGLPKLSEDDLKKKREEAEATNMFYIRNSFYKSLTLEQRSILKIINNFNKKL